MEMEMDMRSESMLGRVVQRMNGRVVLLLASLGCWLASCIAFSLQFLGDRFVDKECLYFTAVNIPIIYFVAATLPSAALTVFIDVHDYLRIARPPDHPHLNRSTDAAAVIKSFVTASLVRVALFLCVVSPFFMLNKTQDFCTGQAEPQNLAFIWLVLVGHALICLIKYFESCYWLFLCHLAALICTSYQGFDYDQPQQLPCMLIVCLLSPVIMFLCGMASSLRTRVPVDQAQLPNDLEAASPVDQPHDQELGRAADERLCKTLAIVWVILVFGALMLPRFH